MFLLNLNIYFNFRLFTSKPSQAEEEDESQKGINKATKGGIVYGEYLQVIILKSSTFRVTWTKYYVFISNISVCFAANDIITAEKKAESVIASICLLLAWQGARCSSFAESTER